MLLPIAALLIAALPAQDPAKQPAPPTRKEPTELERCAELLVLELMQHDGVPTLTLSIRTEGQELIHMARGWADQGRGIPVTNTTRFPIGSLTRVFWSAAVLQLVEQGDLALDDELGKCLDKAPELAQPVRLRHLLEGTSGIAPWSDVFAASDQAPDPALDKEAMLALYAHAPFEFAPGTGYSPDSAGWSLLPLVLEKAWNKPFARGVNAHLLNALGLSHTGVCAAQDPAGAIQECDAALNAHDLDRVLSCSASWPAPPLCSTAQDLAAWMEALGNGQVVKAELLARMTTAVKREGGKSTGHGYALALDELAEHPRWWHSGGMAGFRGRMAWYPQDHLSVAVLANCRDAKLDALEEELARFVLGLTATRPLDLPLRPEESARFCGGYQMASTRVTVSARGTHILWQSPQSERECAWQGRARFIDVKDPEFVLTFDLEGERAKGFQTQRGDAIQQGVRVD